MNPFRCRAAGRAHPSDWCSATEISTPGSVRRGAPNGASKSWSDGCQFPPQQCEQHINYSYTVYISINQYTYYWFSWGFLWFKKFPTGRTGNDNHPTGAVLCLHPLLKDIEAKVKPHAATACKQALAPQPEAQCMYICIYTHIYLFKTMCVHIYIYCIYIYITYILYIYVTVYLCLCAYAYTIRNSGFRDERPLGSNLRKNPWDPQCTGQWP